MKLTFKHWQHGTVTKHVQPMKGLADHFYDNATIWFVGAFTGEVRNAGRVVGDEFTLTTKLAVGSDGYVHDNPVDMVDGDLWAGVGCRPMAWEDIAGHWLNTERDLEYRRVYCNAVFGPNDVKVSATGFSRKQSEANNCYTLGWFIFDRETGAHWFEGCKSWKAITTFEGLGL